MPIEMPDDARIIIQKRDLPSSFKMPQMERAEKHYALGYILSGDRHFITPYEQYDAHDGDITTMPPMLYHRTFSLSNRPYVNYLIKISDSLADEFCSAVDREIWNYVFEQRRLSFDDEARQKIELFLTDMLEIYQEYAPYSEELLKGLLFRLIVLIREKNIAGDKARFKGKLSREIMDAMYFIEQNYRENLRLSDVAGKIGFSEGHFSRLFSSQVGISFSNYLINIRLRHAKELLINTEDSISEIAMMTGFGSGDYLSASFNKYEKTSPTVFRRSIRINT
ncbi:MAG: helix-turn-helix transcriptional regulator [Butyrivibrio sp.]|nr:helix-turn-helix transcriptional regulator [Butyrivibrio sp.]MBQ7615260.1 helix-turn-helix transcriptional regulator [Butyrivibrio sp.]